MISHDTIPSIHFKNFTSPQLESACTTKSFVFLCINILTLGIYGSAEVLAKQHYIRVLKANQKDLQNKATDIIADWEKLEKQLEEIVEQFSDLNLGEEGDECESLQNLLDTSTKHSQIKLFNNYKDASSLSEMALGTIVFVGQLIANLMTLGLYGTYRNYSLKNRMTILESQNDYICEQVNQISKDKFNKIQKLSNQQQRLRQEINQWKQHYFNIDQELFRRRQEVTNVRAQLNLADSEAQRAQRLEQEVDHLIKLQSELGPIPPKYQPRAEDGEVEGVMDIVRNWKEEDLANAEQDPDLKYAKEYKERYGIWTESEEKAYAILIFNRNNLPEEEQEKFLKTQSEKLVSLVRKNKAEDVFEASFAFTFNKLWKMSQQDGKIHFSKTAETGVFPCCHAFYRYMVLDIISGAKIKKDSCWGYELAINNWVSMLPSYPQKIMISNKGEIETVVQYRQRDAFTPSEFDLRNNGVDPVAVKWILEQLSPQEKAYLEVLLLSPMMDNDHLELQNAINFINQRDSRTQLVTMAYGLIDDISVAIQIKFKNQQAACWEKYATDGVSETFYKEEDIPFDVTHIPDTTFVSRSSANKFLSWKLDLEVIGDKRTRGGESRQPDFANLMKESQKNYKVIFDTLSKTSLLNPMESREFKNLPWHIVNKQFYMSHEMIGIDFEGKGGPRCLFSNLLAILVTNSNDLTRENVKALKCAMAAYLDKLYEAKYEWDQYQQLDIEENIQEMKELAELSSLMEKSIQKAHACTVPAYQAWLRGESDRAAKIDSEKLSAFEIQLAAYTMGVRIGLLPMNLAMHAKVDEYGRIVPVGPCYNFGPNTKEILLMGFSSPSPASATYHGLFPRMNLDKIEEEVFPEEFEVISKVNEYWMQIKKYG